MGRIEMINAVSVTNHSGETLRCVLGSPEFSGFSITNMTGIVPGKSEIGIKELATLDGGIFQNAKIQARNIVIDYVFHDYWVENAPGYPEHYRSIEEARREFYRYYVIKKSMVLTIETDLHTYRIDGYVESNEPEIFSDGEGASVSIMCPDPYFRLADEGIDENGNLSVTVFNKVGGFEFPWSNPRFEKTLVFGELDEAREPQKTDLHYDGDVDTGVIFHVFVTGAYVGNYINFNYYGNDLGALITTVRFSNIRFTALDNGLQVGDELIISTIPGKKYAIVKRGTDTINVFACMDILPDWIKLQKGTNWLEVAPGTIAPNIPNVYITIEYPILFAGV